MKESEIRRDFYKEMSQATGLQTTEGIDDLARNILRTVVLHQAYGETWVGMNKVQFTKWQKSDIIGGIVLDNLTKQK